MDEDDTSRKGVLSKFIAGSRDVEDDMNDSTKKRIYQEATSNMDRILNKPVKIFHKTGS